MTQKIENPKIIEIIFDILKSLDDECIYKNLLYLNVNSEIGKFCFYYNEKFKKLLQNNKKKPLKEFFKNPYSPEYEDNEFLSTEETSKIKNKIKNEILALIFLSETLYLSKNNDLNTLIGADEHYKCKNDVCIMETHENKNFILENERNFVWVSGTDGNINKAWCFNLPELLMILITDKINPYTNEKFKKYIYKPILKRYDLECKFCEKYLSLV